MATNRTRSQTSARKNQYSCIVCLEFGNEKNAESCCMDCRLYLCTECLTNHNKQRALNNHEILPAFNENNIEQGFPDGLEMAATESIVCEEHEERVTEMYCKEHDTVCCLLCVAKYHKSCIGVNYISHVTMPTDPPNEKISIQTCLHQNLKILNQLKTSKQQHFEHFENITSFTRQESEEFPVPKKLRRSARIYEAKKKSRKFENETIIKEEEGIGEYIALLDEMRRKIENILKHIASGTNAIDEFVHIKQGKQLALKVKMLVKKLSNSEPGNTSNELHEKTRSLQSIAGIKTDGQNELLYAETIPSNSDKMKTGLPNAGIEVENQTEMYHGKSIPKSSLLFGIYDLKLSSDKLQCFVDDICVLDNDQLIITDSSNNKLKLLDKEFRLIASCDLEGHPGVTCKTGPYEVACMITNNIGCTVIQLASAYKNDLTLTRSFFVKANQYKRGMCFLHGELYALCRGNLIAVLDTSGKVLRAFEIKDLMDRKCSVMANIWAYGSDLLFTDGLKNVYILDIYGKRKAKFADKKFNGLYGLCPKDTGEIFISSYYANTIFLVENNGKTKTEILGQADGIVHPQAVAYIRNTNCLVVGSYGTDNIQVFKLKF